MIVLTYLVTNLIIIAGVVRHWNDGQFLQLDAIKSDVQKGKTP